MTPVGFSTDQFHFSTLPDPFDLDPEIVLTGGVVALVNTSTHDCSLNYDEGRFINGDLAALF